MSLSVTELRVIDLHYRRHLYPEYIDETLGLEPGTAHEAIIKSWELDDRELQEAIEKGVDTWA